ncbi:MAG: PqqD family protein [Mucinivorans sp.]
MLTIKSHFRLRTIAGENIVVDFGQIGGATTKIISLNESSAFLFQKFVGTLFTVDDVKTALIDKYGIVEQDAVRDSVQWVEHMRVATLLSDE